MVAKKALFYHALKHKDTSKPQKRAGLKPPSTENLGDMKLMSKVSSKNGSSKDVFHYSPKSSAESIALSHFSSKGAINGEKKVPNLSK